MNQKRKFLTVAGILGLVVGTGLRLWAHGNAAHFAAGFLLGMSVVLLVAAVVTKFNAAGK
jgi:hypothetical protein